jgi:hypothetical protein
MRFAVLTPLVALTAGAALAQPPTPSLGKVKVRTAVKAAPGDHSPETGTLEPGTYLTVVGVEGNDWLAVQPPNGSVSWVKWALVEPQGKPGGDPLSPPFNAVVRADNGAPAVLRAGAIGDARPLGVQRTKLPEGAIVRVIGPKAKVRVDGDEVETSWYPIVAPADDLRYVRRDAVEWIGTAAANGFVVKSGDTSAKPLPGPPAAPVVRAGGTTAVVGDWTLSLPNGPTPPKREDWPNYHATFREAEKARGAGDVRAAEKLYRQVAEEVGRDGPNKDVELANLCYDRIYLMKKGGAGGDWTGGAWRSSERVVEPAPTAPAAPPELRADRKPPDTAGFLKETRVEINRRRVYVLTDSKGRATHYVASGGVDLDRYLDKWVTVRGDETKPTELRGYPLLVVTQIVDAK